MTGLDLVGRGRPSLPQRLAAQAMALALDTRTPTDTAADALMRLARERRDPLERALFRVVGPDGDPPNPLAARAASALGLALDRLAAPTGDTLTDQARS
jgi:hypothetical protein